MSDQYMQCAKWLNDCGVLPENLRTRLKLNELKVTEFANSLRDGIILCNLMNALIPACIDPTHISRRAQTSQFLCLQNINLFLNACQVHFSLTEKDLFKADMLYDLHIECVMKALSTISNTKLAEQVTGRPGFSITQPMDDSSVNDIYYNVTQQPQEEESFYTPDTFILDNEHEHMYQAIIDKATTNSQQQQQLKNVTKKDHVIREIYDSEMRFLNTLVIICKDFLKPLQSLLTEKDRHIIFINIEVLKELHNTLFTRLREACSGMHGRTSRICQVFDNFKNLMMREYVDYFAGMQVAISKVDSLLSKGGEFKQRLDLLRKDSEMGNFKLSDLLRVPCQRVLKYHLLFNELNKQIDKEHSAKKDVQQTHAGMNELASYLNEAQRDKDILDHMDKLYTHIHDFPFQANTSIKDFGHFIKDDNVRIKCTDERTAKTRTLLLFDKALFICKSKGDNYYYKETLLTSDFKVDIMQNSGSNNDLGNAHTFILVNHERTKSYYLYFKNDKQKMEWKTSILECIDKAVPKGYNANSHIFTLFNFERDLVTCSLCKKVLYGVFYQGYRCDQCKFVAHKDCLTKIQQPCIAPITSRISRISITPLIQTNNNFTSKSMSRLSSASSIKHVQYKVKALYTYNGRPVPPYADWSVLKFNVNDSIVVTDDDDDEWWKGYKMGSSNIEGYFPKSYVFTDGSIISEGSSLASIRSIDKYPWYAAVEREKAEIILSRIGTQPTQAIFLVRPRQEGDYAITIKFETVQHIKIHTIKQIVDGKEQTSFCLVQLKDFPNIIDLVNFYMNQTLQDNFPELRTSLGIPFRDALPDPISTAIVIHDYDPKSLSTNVIGTELEIKKNERVWVVSKEAMGWWKVFNSDGLLGYAPGHYLKEI